MFDSIRTEVAAAYPQTITQHLAPTAEHMRLLSEFEAAARQKVLDSIPLEGNVVGRITTHKSGDRFKTFVLFMLNGERIQLELPELEMRLDPHGSMHAAHRAIADAIAIRITSAAIMSASKQSPAP